MGLKAWAAEGAVKAAKSSAKAEVSGYFEGVILKPDGIRYKRTGGPVAGATAHIETAADARRRVTATRLVTIGVFAFAAKKQTGNVFLTVEHPDYAFVVEVPVKKESDARKFAAKINTAARRSVYTNTE